MIDVHPRIELWCDGLDGQRMPVSYIGNCNASLELSPFPEEAMGWIACDVDDPTAWWPITDWDNAIVDETFCGGYTFDAEDVDESVNAARHVGAVLCPRCAARCSDPDVIELLAKMAAAKTAKGLVVA